MIEKHSETNFKTLDLFDGDESEKRKIRGMALGESNRTDDLELAREIAKELAIAGDGTCDADRVGRVLKNVHDIETLGPAAGSLFKGSDWIFTGQWVKSQRITNHSRMIRVWRLK